MDFKGRHFGPIKHSKFSDQLSHYQPIRRIVPLGYLRSEYEHSGCRLYSTCCLSLPFATGLPPRDGILHFTRRMMQHGGTDAITWYFVLMRRRFGDRLLWLGYVLGYFRGRT